MAKPVYYYTDPVAAVWMVKTYRLKIQAGPFCLQQESVPAFLEMLGRGVTCARYVVHPDSTAVFDPKAGDLVEEGGARPKVKKLAAKDFPLTGTSYEIIRRGGSPFFTPERATG